MNAIGTSGAAPGNRGGQPVAPAAMPGTDNCVHIRPSRNWFDIPWREIAAHRELLALLAKRDITLIYQQTILGPAWFLIQPILTATVFSVVFGRVARIPTEGLPHSLFYLSGLLFWNYFSHSLEGAANAFSHGKALFSKVYFPRLVIPLTFPISHLVFLGWNFLVLALCYAFHAARGLEARPTWWLMLSPALVLYVGALAFGVGLLFAALTVKYRDLKMAMPFILQVWFFSSPIIFSLHNVTTGWIGWVLLLNPLSVAIEALRLMLFGSGVVTWHAVAIGLAEAAAALLLGLGLFNRVQGDFVDTI